MRVDHSHKRFPLIGPQHAHVGGLVGGGVAEEVDVLTGLRLDAGIAVPPSVGEGLLMARKVVEHALRPALGMAGHNRL